MERPSHLLFLMFPILSLLMCLSSAEPTSPESTPVTDAPNELKGLRVVYDNEDERKRCQLFNPNVYHDRDLGYVSEVLSFTIIPDCMLRGDRTKLDILRRMNFSELRAKVIQFNDDHYGPLHVPIQFIMFYPDVPKTHDGPLTDKQRDFFKNFDYNLDVMAEVIGGRVVEAREFLNHKNWHLVNKLLKEQQLRDLRVAFGLATTSIDSPTSDVLSQSVFSVLFSGLIAIGQACQLIECN
eukprot:GHVS01004108.1.p1 GENE.GHVS01004108.1~~GHVS01004108.1.p1  ORF type:complete len:239 (+),score=16.58 GHVS01004108.1:408-1124(+)